MNDTEAREKKEAREKDHQKFLELLRASEDDRWLVAYWMAKRGHSVWLPPLHCAPRRDQWRDFSDIGDLHVSYRIEAKRLKDSFTGPSDWPFKQDFIVCSQGSFDRALDKPFAYMILSNDRGRAALVYASKRSRWRVRRIRDSRFTDHEQDFYLAPIETVNWLDFLNGDETWNAISDKERNKSGH